jgi:oligopeptide/dipeptide ABC transporter ATP-binding protein
MAVETPSPNGAAAVPPASPGDKLLQVTDLRTYFTTRKGFVKAVDGITYDVNKGEIVAMVGESGCGKTVSVLSLLKLVPTPPARILSGEAIFEGRDLLKLNRNDMRHVRGRRIAVVFQEPMTSLNPVLTIGRQMYEGLTEHKIMDKKAAIERSIDLLDQVGIPDPRSRLNQYPDQFSGGMRQRVMLAIALSCSPSLIIADEPTTAVDVTVQAQLLELIHELQQSHNVSVILITHNMGVVAKYAHRVNVMYAGRIVEHAETGVLFKHPVHPYTKALLECIPRLDRDRHDRLEPIQGQPPDLVNRPSGCPYWPRCKEATEDCKQEWPELRPVVAAEAPLDPSHIVACQWK